jgi:Rps23 Pro-64 3,4-dihydroxylase Tpa1-like proline 4-hydroxylase
MENVISKIENENMEELKEIFKQKERLRISNFLKVQFAEFAFKQAFSEKNWLLATGIDNVKYEKPDNIQNQKINGLQIKNVNNAFSKDQFTYIFYRSMNGVKMSFVEYTLRQTLSSPEFINMLNEITGLNLTKLTTLFMSKYKSGNYLSPHSDKGNGRLAFVINLSKFWKPQYGGALHFMNDQRTEVIDTFVPNFNTFSIFHVPDGKGIPHFVGHVAPNVKFNRFAVSGWFE